MSKFAVSVLLLIVIGLGVLALFVGTTDSSNGQSASGAFETNHESAVAESEAAKKEQTPPGQLQQRPERRTTLQLSDPVQLGDKFWDPKSPEEVAWRNQHLFPSQNTFTEAADTFHEAANLDHRSPITAIDLVRAELYASAFPEDPGYSISYLERAAAEGSIYALEALSRVHWPTDTKGDFIVSRAYLRAAEMRGNWALSTLRLDDLAPEQRIAVDLTAQQILREIEAYRSSRGMWPLERDVAPGLDEFLEALRRHLDRHSEDGD